MEKSLNLKQSINHIIILVSSFIGYTRKKSDYQSMFDLIYNKMMVVIIRSFLVVMVVFQVDSIFSTRLCFRWFEVFFVPLIGYLPLWIKLKETSSIFNIWKYTNQEEKKHRTTIKRSRCWLFDIFFNNLFEEILAKQY